MIKVKILTHLGTFVDENRLKDGIYSREIPHLYRGDFTMKQMEEYVIDFCSITGFDAVTLVGNLRQCELKAYVIVAEKEYEWNDAKDAPSSDVPIELLTGEGVKQGTADFEFDAHGGHKWLGTFSFNHKDNSHLTVFSWRYITI